MERLIAIHPFSFIKALSMALELSENGLSQHHCRTAIIASKIGHRLGLSQMDLQTLIYAALLHDLGAASDWDEKHHLIHLKIGEGVYNHAEAGYLLLKDSPQLGALAVPIRFHHDRFQGGNPSGLIGAEIPLLARIIHLADRTEVLISDDKHILKQDKDILQQIKELDGSYFDPELVNILEQLAKRESFWLDLATSDYHQRFFASLEFHGKVSFGIDDLLHIAEIFSTVIDRTSHFTAIHSKSVARIAVYLAKKCRYSEEEQQLLRLAGLLHDLGKLAVPNSILNKPGPLTDEEFLIVKQHPYYTYRILQQVNGFELISLWAAQHHEKLDGQGYPFGYDSSDIRHGSKILAVADVFCALIEKRPYRDGMSLTQVKSIMISMVNNGNIDEFLVNDLLSSASYAYQLVDNSNYAFD